MAFTWSDLLKSEVQDFIRQHTNDDEKKLILKNPLILGIPAMQIARQIVGRRKAKDKLPLYFSLAGIIYPAALNMEQSSSELTARHKQLFLRAALENKSLDRGADLTGGFGVDSFFISKECLTLDYVEPSESLLDIARHNHQCLGATNIYHTTSTASDFLDDTKNRFDFIFLDPSRRKNDIKVLRLSECEPNPVELLTKLFQKTELVLLKASPLLDLLKGCEELRAVAKIVVLSVKNECKELLFLCRQGYHDEPIITCVNYSGGSVQPDEFTFSFSEEKAAVSVFSDVQRYLYEPNASILKGGGFKIIGQRFELAKMHQHTHLYTSERLVPDFPGRIFSTEQVDPGEKTVRSLFPDGQVNVVTRNYPMSPDQIRKKFKLKDGGDKFLIGFTGRTSKQLVVASRLPRSGSKC